MARQKKPNSAPRFAGHIEQLEDRRVMAVDMPLEHMSASDDLVNAAPPLEHHVLDEADFWVDPSQSAGLDEYDHALEQMASAAHTLTGWYSVQTNYGFTGAGQTVAVIDSGIAWDHTALGGGLGANYRVVGGWDFTAENDANPYDDGPFGSQGTHVAGVIGSSDSAQPGVASGVDLVGLRVVNDAGEGYYSWIESALQWVHANRNAFAKPITTINLSLGVATWNASTIPAWTTLEDEFAQLKADGIFIAVSAGNSFTNFNAPGLSYPAASPYVVPVMSTDNAGALSYFSQRLTSAIAAPGQGITSTVPDYAGNNNGVTNDFAAKDGTNCATPYIAGASVLIRQAMQFVGMTNITQDTIYNQMMTTADSIVDSVTGLTFKRLNLARAIDTLMPADDYGSTAAAAYNLGTLTTPISRNGQIANLADVDFFKFTASGTGTVTFTAPGGITASWQVVGATPLAGQPAGTVAFAVQSGQVYTVGLSSTTGVGNYTLAGSFTPTDDYGSTAATAHNLGTLSLGSPASLSGVIGTSSDVDFFKFTASGNGTVTFTATGGITAAWQVVGATPLAGQPAGTVAFAVQSGQVYTVGLSSTTGVGSYTLGGLFAPTDDYGSTAATAHNLGTLSSPISLSGVIGTSSDVDFFKFTASGSGTVTFTATGGITASWQVVGATPLAGQPAGTVAFAVQSGQVYTVGLSSTGVGSYTLAGSFAPADDYGSTAATAYNLGTLSSPISLPGLIGTSSDVDFFKFTASGSGTVTFTATGGITASWQVVGATPLAGQPAGTLSFAVQAGQVYTIGLSSTTGVGGYMLAGSFTPTDDYGSTAATAYDLGMLSSPISISLAGLIETASDLDFFKFTAAGAGTVTFSAVGGITASWQVVGATPLAGQPAGTVSFAVQAGQVYTIGLSSTTGVGSYTLGGLFASTDDYGSTAATAYNLGTLSLGSPVSRTGVIGTSSDVDFFKFTASGTGTVTFTAPGGITASWQVVGATPLAGQPAGTVAFAVQSGQVYTVGLSSTTGVGNYTLAGSFTPTDDYGSTAATAHNLGTLSLGSPASLSGVIGTSSDVDFFKFTASGNGTVTFTATGGITAAWQVVGATPLAGQPAGTVAFAVQSGQVYTVGLSSTTGVGSYTLGGLFAPTDDYGSTAATAHNLGTLSSPISLSGVIGTSSDVDFFKFTASGSGTVTFTATGGITASWQVVGATPLAGQPAGTVAFAVQSGQVYTVGLSSTGVGSYTLAGSFAPADDYGSTAATAYNLGTLSSPISLPGLIGTSSDVDFFKFTASGSGTVTFTATGGITASWQVVGATPLAGQPAGTLSFAVQAGQVYTIGLSSTTGVGGYMLAGAMSFAAADLGSIAFTQLNNLSVSGEQWYRLTATRTGALTALSTFNAAGGQISVAFFNASQQLLASGAANGGEARVDVSATAGGVYYLRVSGNNADVDLKLANLVSVSGTTITIGGTSASDAYIVATSSFHWLSVNGVSYGYTFEMANQIMIDGAAGDDSIAYYGSTGAETVSLRATGSTFVGNGLTLSAINIEDQAAFGGGGADVANLYDSAGNDSLTALPTKVTLTLSTGQVLAVNGFGKAKAWATTGADAASFTDSTGGDIFYGGDVRGILTGAGFWNEAEGFDQVIAYSAAGGADVANLYDSAGNDLLVALPNKMTFTLATGKVVEANGFSKAKALATTGSDTASFTDSAGADLYIAGAIRGILTGVGFWNEAEGFDGTVAHATTGGIDRLEYYDSAGDDAFIGWSNRATISGTGFSHDARGFEWGVTYGGAGGYDLATLYDSTDNDTLTAWWDRMSLVGSGFAHDVRGFDKAIAYSTAGGVDAATFYDAKGDDHFIAGELRGILMGAGYWNQADGFDWTIAYSSAGGKDWVDYYDSAGDDLFTARPDRATFAGTGFAHEARGFGSVKAWSLLGGNDRAVFFDSAGNDQFIAGSVRAILTSAKFRNEAEGFRRTEAHATAGGKDRVDLYGSDGIDSLVGAGSQATYSGVGYNHEMDGFDTIMGRGFAANDVVNLAATDWVFSQVGA